MDPNVLLARASAQIDMKKGRFAGGPGKPGMDVSKISPEKNAAQQQCFARRHMPPGVLAFYSYALALSRKTGIFWTNVRRDCWEFHVSKNTVSKWMRTLDFEGWFVPVDGQKRTKRSRNPRTGMLLPRRFRVLTHDQWCRANSGACRFPPVPKSGTG
jgi:hypothetical protein